MLIWPQMSLTSQWGWLCCQTSGTRSLSFQLMCPPHHSRQDPKHHLCQSLDSTRHIDGPPHPYDSCQYAKEDFGWLFGQCLASCGTDEPCKQHECRWLWSASNVIVDVYEAQAMSLDCKQCHCTCLWMASNVIVHIYRSLAMSLYMSMEHKQHGI